MKTIIYRISNLQCVGVVDENTTLEWQLKNNVIANLGGVVVDYAVIETNLDNIELQLVNGVVTVVEKIIDPVIPPLTDMELMQIQLDTTQATVLDNQNMINMLMGV